MNNSFKQVLEHGESIEKKVIAYLQEKKPDWGFKRIGGAYQPDGVCKIGAVEIKAHRGWYENPVIETKNISGGAWSGWHSDDRVKLYIAYHAGWLHLYNTEKLKKAKWLFHMFCCPVDQGDGTKKTMQFVNVKLSSSLQSDHCNIDDDPKRWDCKFIGKDNPYIGSMFME